MSEHVSLPADEGEDDDLELLRIAALKSINAKKEQSSQYNHSPSSHAVTSAIAPSTLPSQTLSPSYSSIPVKHAGVAMGMGHEASNMLSVAPQPYYGTTNHVLPIQQQRGIASGVDSYAARQRLEKLDLNEPYIPQRVPPIPIAGQTIGPNGGWIPDPTQLVPAPYTPYIPQKVTEPMPVNVNVQLSPRSMAFVAENNDILMRRKGENVSPNYAYRSPSPAYRNSSLGRWSKSPSPPMKANSRSPGNRNRLHHYSVHHRSVSRSPPPSRQRSPALRRRTMSRSPPPHQAQHLSRHQSPNPFNRYPSRSPPPHARRMKSRSPQNHMAKHKLSPLRRHMSRSPNPPHNGRPHSRSPLPPNGRRSPMMLPRHANRMRRSPSPQHNRKRSPPSNQFHDMNEGPPQRHHFNRDRRSPLHLIAHRRSMSPGPLLPRPRSHSRSPHRRYGRRSRERNVNVNPTPRRRSPYGNNNRRRYDAPGQNGFRNNPPRGRKRSASPTIRDRPVVRRSRTRSPERNRRSNGNDRKRPRRGDNDDRRGMGPDVWDKNESRRNDDRGSRQVQHQPSSRRDREEPDSKRREVLLNSNGGEEVAVPAEEKPSKETSAAKRSDSPKQSLELENKVFEQSETAAMDVVEREESSDEEEEDGIDLFASEESESENEGRFKSSTNKTERATQAPTVSFTKLNETRPMEVKELTDMDAASNNRDRERDRGRDRVRNNYGRSRAVGGRFRSSESGRNSRDRDRRNKTNSSSNKSRRDRDRDRERDRGGNNRDWDSTMSKTDEERKGGSGTAAVDRPMFKSTFQALENEGRSSKRNSRDRDTNDRKNLSNRRRNNSKDRRGSPDPDPEQLSSSTSLNAAASSLQSTTNASSSCPSSPARGQNEGGLTGKRPIHLRLGAKTNTFKSTKKTTSSAASPWSSTTSNGNGNGSGSNNSTEKV